MEIKIRPLKADEIECRIARITPNGVALLLYKTARTDAKLLDETFGAMNWQNDFYMVGDTMYCKIGVRDDEGNWVWKSDCGTESNMEAEKGRSSDCFKRAGFKWGIGSALYSAPDIFISPENCKLMQGKCYDKFDVADIGYDQQGNISKLRINNLSLKKIAFEFGCKTEKKPVAELKQERGTITDDQAQELDNLLAVKNVDAVKFFEYFKISSLLDMKVDDYDKALAMLKKKADK